MTIKLSLLFLALCVFSCKEQNTPEKDPNVALYVGTYTNGESEGIYQFQFNTETGELTNKLLAATTENPSFITYSADKKQVYATNETNDGLLSSFKVEDAGTLSLLNSVSSNGASPCYVAVNAKGDKAVVANYTGGTVSIYNILNDGFLTEATQVFNHNVADSVSHAHSAQFFDNDLFVADLGRNAMYNYKLAENNAYKLDSPSIIEMMENAGPRHFSLTKDGRFMYVINEYAGTITAAKKVNGSFELINHVSTLDDAFEGRNSCADIHLSQDERFLYGSNRGENSIVVFKRDENTGELEKIQSIKDHINWPRNFSLDPTGKYMLVANQKSNSISVYTVDSESGKLTFLNEAEIPEPVCLLF